MISSCDDKNNQVLLLGNCITRLFTFLIISLFTGRAILLWTGKFNIVIKKKHVIANIVEDISFL